MVHKINMCPAPLSAKSEILLNLYIGINVCITWVGNMDTYYTIYASRT